MDELVKTCLCASLLLFLFDVLGFSNAQLCSNIACGSQGRRFLDSAHMNDSQISLRRLTTEPKTNAYKQQIYKGTVGSGRDITLENPQSPHSRVSRQEYSTLLKSISPEEDAAVISLMTSIVTRELSQCVLVLLWDKVYASTPLVDYLAHLPNPKQVVEVLGSREVGPLLWRARQCRGYLVLLTDSSPLMRLVDHTPHNAWDYSGRFVVVGLNRAQLNAFTHTRKGSVTEHIVGIVQVGTFNFPPAVIYRRGKNGCEGHWYGDNIRLAEAVADVLNFSLRYKRPPAGEFWGKVTVNGTWDGLVGMLGRGEADIVLANLFVADVKGRTEFQEYTSPHGQVETCFMVKKPSPFPRWQAVALPYTLEAWIAVLGVTLMAGPLLHTLAHSSITRDGERLARRSLLSLSLYTLAMHLRIPQTLVPLRTSLQVFVVFLWVHVIIVTVAYSANLTAFLTVERIPEGITSLKQLYDSKLFVYGIGGPFFADNMAESSNEYVRGLVSRFIPMPSSETIHSHLMKGRGVHIDALNHLSYVKSLYTDSRGSSTLRIIQECFQPYSVAMGVQSHSPLKRNFNMVINWVFEGGLVNRWFEETLGLVKKYKREDSHLPHEEEKGDANERSGRTISLTMEHLQGVFVILCFGYVASTFVFITETIAEKK